jgi:hypothetical protein
MAGRTSGWKGVATYEHHQRHLPNPILRAVRPEPATGGLRSSVEYKSDTYVCIKVIPHYPVVGWWVANELVLSTIATQQNVE